MMEPVTTAVSPVPSIPFVTSSAVEDPENSEAFALLSGHISLSLSALFEVTMT